MTVRRRRETTRRHGARRQGVATAAVGALLAGTLAAGAFASPGDVTVGRVADINPAAGVGSSPANLTNVNGTLYLKRLRRDDDATAAQVRKAKKKVKKAKAAVRKACA